MILRNSEKEKVKTFVRTFSAPQARRKVKV